MAQAKAMDAYEEALRLKASQKKGKQELVELDRCELPHLRRPRISLTSHGRRLEIAVGSH